LAFAVSAALTGCATSNRSARGEVLRQIVPSTVQLRCEREGGNRRAASGVVVARDGDTRRTQEPIIDRVTILDDADHGSGRGRGVVFLHDRLVQGGIERRAARVHSSR